MALQQITTTFTSSTSWQVPANCVSVDLVEGIGAGGGGRRGFNNRPGQGGAGAGYSASDPGTIPAGRTFYINVGAAGVGATTDNTNGTAGGDTWVRWDGTNAAPTTTSNGILAKGGQGGGANGETSGSLGGQASAGIGTTKYSGGNSGAVVAASGGYSGSGGGASASKYGPGGDGGAGSVGGSGRGGGGGGGRNGSDGLNSGSATGGAAGTDGGTGGV